MECLNSFSSALLQLFTGGLGSAQSEKSLRDVEHLVSTSGFQSEAENAGADQTKSCEVERTLARGWGERAHTGPTSH